MWLKLFFSLVLAMFAPPTAESHYPSAPPASMFDSVPGYEGTVAGGGTLCLVFSMEILFAQCKAIPVKQLCQYNSAAIVLPL